MAFWRKDPDVHEYLARKEYKKAIELLRERLKKDPGSSEALMLIADALLADNQVDRAVEEYKRLASRFTELGFIAKAVAVYKKVLRVCPTARDVEYLMSELSDSPAGSAAPTAVTAESPAPGVPAGQPPDASSLSLEFENKLLRDLTTEEVKQVINSLALRHYDAGVVVVQEGEPGDSLFLLVRGQVKVLTHDSENREVFLAALDEGDFFGEISLLTGKPRTATIVTSVDSDLLELTRSDYERIVARFPNVRHVMENFHEQRAYRTVEALIQAYQKRVPPPQ